MVDSHIESKQTALQPEAEFITHFRADGSEIITDEQCSATQALSG
jgi:hypothetical protein